MQIKNIQQFRSNWRTQQGYDMPNWDENFIGSTHSEKSGFYKMVNGIVNNIKADLTPKLQNAQDEQAIYEFLQNAADSHSTECAVIYDEQYFMVLNNGKPFTESDLRALLNSFQGTKADKTKPENCGKIGRYGIGFKLAYRLMGKSDGAEELLRDLAGPLIFSWHNNKQLTALESWDASKGITAVGGTNEATAPWLLKVILACFPTAPSESVKDLDYNSQVLFQNEEVQELVGFLKKHKSQLEHLSLEQGSLFFLKFGPKKHEKLKESLLNIKSGIGYAMNTLKTLSKVVLQDEVVEKYDVNFEKYAILPNTDDFKRIDPEFPFCPIDIALGFPASLQQAKELKKSPSIYQFFPMRNERHNLAFFIHGTSFSKITDRTRLDDQGEANIETFKYITKSLKRNLNKYKMGNFAQFIKVYQGLLLSDRSEEYDADLVNTHLYDPLLHTIRGMIPTHKQNFYLKDIVVIKNTRLPVDPMAFGIGKEWFYWHDVESDKDLMKEAANRAKLGLDRWGLRELIMEGNINLINNWLEYLDEEDYQIFVEELKDITFDAAFLEKFQELQCFKFSSNQGDANFYGLKDLQVQENIFLMSEQTMSIREEIKALGFAVLEFNILEYAVVLQQLEQQLDYLTSTKALFTKITQRLGTVKLSVEQKHRLFDFFKGLEGLKTEELRAIPLYKNRLGIATGLQGILPSGMKVPEWLEEFKIEVSEEDDRLHNYYIGDKEWEIYTHIIVPHWNNLVAQEQLSKEEAAKVLYEKVITYYKLKSGHPKLDDKAYIFTENGAAYHQPNQVFYHKALASIEDYASLRSAIAKTLDKALPHPSVLDFLGMDPFRTAATTADKTWKITLKGLPQRCQEAKLTAKEKLALFELLQQIIPSKELATFPLFENTRGEYCALQQLIASEEQVESWLTPFKIKSSEDAAVLKPYMVGSEAIYTNIILPTWDKIIEQKSIQSNIASFYEQVTKYASLAKAAKSFSDQAYIYVDANTGFVTKDEVFFHNRMVEFDAYADLATAIQATTGFSTPNTAILPQLTQGVFKTKDSIFVRALTDEVVTLNRKEALALQAFLDLTRENFFELMYLEEGDNSREYKLAKKGRNTPYYLEKSQRNLAPKIAEAFGDSYKLLPTKLYDETFQNKGLVQGAELFTRLTKSKDAPPELLSAIVAQSGSTDAQEYVLKKINHIILKQGQTYGKDTFEHQTLHIFRNKDANHDNVRSKLYVEDSEGVLYKLTDIAFDSMVTLAIERQGKFQLALNEVLPRFAKLQALIEDVITNIKDYEAPTVLRRRCFAGEEYEAKTILNELKKEYKTLENASQLAFVVLLAQSTNNSRLVRDFSVKNSLGETTPLNRFDCFYLEAPDFIAPEAVLDAEAYKGLGELLKISDKRRSFDFGDQMIAAAPYMDRTSYYCSPLRTIEEGQDASEWQKQVIEHAYQLWSSEEDANRPDKLQLSDNEWNNVLGLPLRELVYPKEYALVKEQMPDWLALWLSDDKQQEDLVDEEEENEVETPMKVIPKGKIAFLRALGVNTRQTALVRLRHYFQTNEEQSVSKKTLNAIVKKGEERILNTILWLQAEGTEFSSADERVQWLRRLYNQLDKISPSLPLPHITAISAEETVFTYKVECQNDGTLYYFDAKQQQQLAEQYDLPIQMVFESLRADDKFLTNIEIKQLALPTGKVEQKLDIHRLEENSAEWGASQYLRWKEQVDYQVYLYDGAMPQQVWFLDTIVKEFAQDDATLQGQIAYVNSQSTNIEETLFSIAKYNTLTEAMLLPLLRYKNEGVKETNHKVVERVVETVYVEEQLEENEEAIENPTVDLIKEQKEQQSKGRLKLAFDINELPEDMLEQLMKYAKNAKMIVKKQPTKKA